MCVKKELITNPEKLHLIEVIPENEGLLEHPDVSIEDPNYHTHVFSHDGEAWDIDDINELRSKLNEAKEWNKEFLGDYKPDFIGKIPILTEMEVLPADQPKNFTLGWTVKENIGIGVFNTRGIIGFGKISRISRKYILCA